MEILTNYNKDTLQLISDNQEYNVPNFWEYYVDSYFDLKDTWDNGVGDYWIGQGVETKEDFGRIHWELAGQNAGRGYPQVKLSVFRSNGSFLRSGDLTRDIGFYISQNQLFLKPNQFLDKEGFSEGNYNLQFDFIHRFRENNLFYISEISPSAKEIRIEVDPNVYADLFDDNLEKHILSFLNNQKDTYQFNSFIELSEGRLIPINGYAIDNVTNDKRTLILKLNQPLPTGIVTLSKNFRIVNKFLSSQAEKIFYRDVEGLAISGLGLEIDQGYLTEDIFEEDIDYSNYQSMTSSYGKDIFDEVKRQRKDINLNIDYSNFSNHTFFGSAESKLINFKNKVVKLEGLYGDISSSLAFSSSLRVVEKRKDLFKQIENIKNDFTHYEYFLYNDGQSYSSASAPGIGTNLAGTDFSNKVDNSLTTLQDQEGFNKVHKKSNNGYIHLFTDIYKAESPPFYNSNKAVYLSFILRGDGDFKGEYELHISGGDANVNYDNDGYKNYPYDTGRQLPYDASSGSAILNPTSTGSNYRRYIFKGEQLYWRPSYTNGDYYDINWIVQGNLWNNKSYYQILSGSNVISASISGSSFGRPIKDSSGLYKSYFFPDTTSEFHSGSNISGPVTASVMPQGDLFPVVSVETGSKSSFFTDVVVSYNNPEDIHPFSKIYRPPSGSYAGSDKWNNWYNGMIDSASNYDNDNIHSLVNNLPFALRTNQQHKTLRDFVNILGEEFDLLRKYIDNYQNFYEMGYKNPHSIPDTLLPIIGDSIGFDLMNPYSGSITNYLENNEVDGIGIKTAINSLWRKILNNVIYIYKTKGTRESISALLNLYGFDAHSFQLQEYGGSIDEHNPTVIKNKSGNISFIEESTSFPMLNLDSGSDYLTVDWWTDDANANGIEFLFQANKSTNTQTLLRSSGSNDYWDLRIIPSGSSNVKGKIEFRLNYTKDVSSAIGTNHVSMSTDYINNVMSDNVFNILLQRNYATSSNTVPASHFTQSYHMYIGRKDDDKIRDVQFISMSSHNANVTASRVSGSYINQNFITSSALTGKNLFVGETLSGSVAEIRAWDSYVSMSKFKQHILNYNSVVGGSVTSGVNNLIYRFRLNENIPNYNRHSDSTNLKIYDSNPKHIKDYSHLISTQPSLNFRTTMTEQTFYKFGVRGTDEIKNSNQTNLGSKLKVLGSLDPNTKTVGHPYDETPKVQTSNKVGKSFSYIDAIDSLIINQMSDFKLDDYLEDGTMDGNYTDLVDLRKQLISDNNIKIDVVKNLKSAESLFNAPVLGNLQKLLPAKSSLDFSYNVKNDILFRPKIKNAILQTKLNPNTNTSYISASFLKPTLSSTANEKFKNGNISVSDDQLSTTGLANHNYENGTADILDNELSVTSLYNENVKTNHSTPLDIVDLSNSKTESIFTMTPDITSLLLGSKNEFYKNHGKGDNQVYFKSKNQGTDGNFNTYKYETRFTFPIIGDTEEFYPVSGAYKNRKNQRHPYNHHDNFRHFFNRQFVDSGSYTYTSFFAAHAEPGRMIGRTRFFRTDSDGNITYPSNHFINARTSKDVLDNLIYKGTQNDGTNPTTDPLDRDPKRTTSAYTINVGGSDTTKKLKVVR